MAATINADNGVSSGSAGLKSSADSSGVLQLQTNGTTAVTVDTSQNVGVGATTAALNAATGRVYLAIKGTGTGQGDGNGVFQLQTNSAGSTLPNIGNIEWNLPDNTSSSTTRVAYISVSAEGATANNRGATMQFATKSDGVSSAGALRMVIDSSGNVGIGTSSPDIYSQGGRMFTVSNTTASGYAWATLAGGSGGGGELDFGNQTIRHGAIASLNGSALAFYTNNTNSGVAVAERMRIDSSGNVGIGTGATTGYGDLTVKRQATTASNATLSLVSGTAGAGRLYFGNTQNASGEYDGYIQYDQGYRIMQFGTSQTERMRIDASGNLLVGTIAVTGLVTSQKNTAGNYSAAFGARAIGTANSQVAGIMFLPTFSNVPDYTPRRAADIWGGFNGNWGGEFLVFGVGTGAGNDAGNQTVERMRIDAGGNLTITGATATKASGTTWANPSDQRLKDNIRDYVKGTTELMQVRVREWEYNGKGGTVEGMKGLGVIADEVMTVLPATVENYDAKLNADDEETTAIKKFDATEITWLLVKTAQEQQAIITQLQADVAALKGTS
jgi:hypothetical protein